MFTWLLFNTLCALPLALLALAARRLLRSQPGLEHLLWLLVCVRLVVPPFPGSTEPSPAAPLPALVSSDTPGLGDELVAALTRTFGRDWSTWATRILLGAFIGALGWVVLRELARAWAVERCVRRARARDELEHHVQAVARGLGMRAPRVRVSDEAAGPFLWSLRRPVLVLPAEEGLPEPTVLAHELAHLRRRDHWAAWLELLVQAFHFWNPLFWLARARLRFTSELACDRWVVQRFPARRRAFATALIDTAERAAHTPFVPRAVQSIGMDRSGFEERLTRILRGDARARSGWGWLAAGALLAGLTLPGWGAPTLDQFRRALPELPAGLDHETWRRSLEQAQARLARDPSDGAAWMQSGVALLGLGRPTEALAAFRRQEALGHELQKALYNQACVHVKLDQPAEALACLGRACELGLDVPALAAADPDLAELREDPDFHALFGP